MHAKFEVSSFNRSRDIVVPKIGHVTPSRPVNWGSPVTPDLPIQYTTFMTL